MRVLMTRDHDSIDGARTYDPLHFGLWRVAALAEQGFAARAATECERILAESSRPDAKALTLLKLGDTALRLGDVGKQSRHCGQHAPTAHCRPKETPGRSKSSQGFSTLNGDAPRTSPRGPPDHGRVIRDSGAESAEHVDRDDLRVDVLLDRRFSAYLGDAGAASEAVACASKIARRNRDVSLSQRVEIAVLAATFAQDGIVDASTRFHRLNEAMLLRILGGVSDGVLFASVDSHTNASACETTTGRKPSLTKRCRWRDRWRAAEPSSSPRQPRAGPAPPEAMVRLGPAALRDRDLRGSHDRSLDKSETVAGRIARAPPVETWKRSAPLSSAIAGARKLQQPRSQAMALREFALASYAAGRADDARDCIKSAVRIVEAGSDARELHVTYQAASRILRNARMSRLATQASNGRRT